MNPFHYAANPNPQNRPPVPHNLALPPRSVHIPPPPFQALKQPQALPQHAAQHLFRPPPSFPIMYQPPPPPQQQHQSAPPALITPASLGFSQTENDKMCKLFIGNIPAAITEEWVERYLSTCGSVREWKRMRAHDGALKAFGFVTYLDPMGSVRALDLLVRAFAFKLDQDGSLVVLLAEDADAKHLLIKADDDTLKLLERFKSARGTQPLDTEHHRLARRRIDDTIAALCDMIGMKKPTASDISSSTGLSVPAGKTLNPTPIHSFTATATPSGSAKSDTPTSVDIIAPDHILDLDSFLPKTVAHINSTTPQPPVVEQATVVKPPRKCRWDQEQSQPTTDTQSVVVEGTKTSIELKPKPLSSSIALPKPSTSFLQFNQRHASGKRSKPNKFTFGTKPGEDEEDETSSGSRATPALSLFSFKKKAAVAVKALTQREILDMSDQDLVSYPVPWTLIGEEMWEDSVPKSIRQRVASSLGGTGDDAFERYLKEVLRRQTSASELVLEVEVAFGGDRSAAQELVSGVVRDLLVAVSEDQVSSQ